MPAMKVPSKEKDRKLLIEVGKRLVE